MFPSIARNFSVNLSLSLDVSEKDRIEHDWPLDWSEETKRIEEIMLRLARARFGDAFSLESVNAQMDTRGLYGLSHEMQGTLEIKGKLNPHPLVSVLLPYLWYESEISENFDLCGRMICEVEIYEERTGRSWSEYTDFYKDEVYNYPDYVVAS